MLNDVYIKISREILAFNILSVNPRFLIFYLQVRYYNLFCLGHVSHGVEWRCAMTKFDIRRSKGDLTKSARKKAGPSHTQIYKHDILLSRLPLLSIGYCVMYKQHVHV